MNQDILSGKWKQMRGQVKQSRSQAGAPAV